MTYGRFYRNALDALSQAYSPEEARSVLRLLAEDLLAESAYIYNVESSEEITSSHAKALDDAIKRLRGGEPVQYVTGFKTFCGRPFRVSHDVLIPRGETEELCLLATSSLQKDGISDARCLDLCTGSGCIAWTMAASGICSEVLGIDISHAALEIARSQGQFWASRGLDLPNVEPKFAQMDLLDPSNLDFFKSQSGKFQIILSNPPYVLESEKSTLHPLVLDNDPELALFVPDAESQIFNTIIAQIALYALSPGGILIVEINELLGPQSRGIFSQAGLSCVHTVIDTYGKDRFIFAQKPQ